MFFVVFDTSESCAACGSFLGMLSELQIGAVLYGHFRGDSYSEIEEVLKKMCKPISKGATSNTITKHLDSRGTLYNFQAAGNRKKRKGDPRKVSLEA